MNIKDTPFENKPDLLDIAKNMKDDTFLEIIDRHGIRWQMNNKLEVIRTDRFID